MTEQDYPMAGEPGDAERATTVSPEEAAKLFEQYLTDYHDNLHANNSRADWTVQQSDEYAIGKAVDRERQKNAADYDNARNEIERLKVEVDRMHKYNGDLNNELMAILQNMYDCVDLLSAAGMGEAGIANGIKSMTEEIVADRNRLQSRLADAIAKVEEWKREAEENALVASTDGAKAFEVGKVTAYEKALSILKEA